MNFTLKKDVIEYDSITPKVFQYPKFQSFSFLDGRICSDIPRLFERMFLPCKVSTGMRSWLDYYIAQMGIYVSDVKYAYLLALMIEAVLNVEEENILDEPMLLKCLSEIAVKENFT